MTILQAIEMKKKRVPWTNTVAYYPFTSTSTNIDQSWNGHTLTTFTWITFETIASWLSVARFSWSSSWNSCKVQSWDFTMNNRWTLSIWANPEHNGWGYPDKYILFRASKNPNVEPTIWMHTARSGVYTARNRWNWVWVEYYSTVLPIVDWNWHHFLVTASWTSLSLYIDWIFVWDNTTTVPSMTDTGRIFIGSNDDNYYWYKWLLSEAIFEDRVRAIQEVVDYYNNSKSNYWL